LERQITKIPSKPEKRCERGLLEKGRLSARFFSAGTEEERHLTKQRPESGECQSLFAPPGNGQEREGMGGMAWNLKKRKKRENKTSNHVAKLQPGNRKSKMSNQKGVERG